MGSSASYGARSFAVEDYMRKYQVFTVLFITAAFAAGNLFAQAQGRMQWYTIASTELQFDWSDEAVRFNGDSLERPGFGFYEDEDGYAYSWDSVGEILMWYGRELISMWASMGYRMGWGFRSEWVVMYDNGNTTNVGGRMRIRSSGSEAHGGSGETRFNPIAFNNIAMYGWYQAWNRRLFFEMNPFGATSSEFGTVWRTPGGLFHNTPNGRRNNINGNTGLQHEDRAYYDTNETAFFRLQVRNLVENLNFGFTLPNFGAFQNLKWGYNSKMTDGQPAYWEAHDIFTRASFGARYNAFDWAVSGGFILDPDKAQRAYLGGDYRLLSQNLRIMADIKMLNIGALFDEEYRGQFDLDMAQGVSYTSGPWFASFTMYQKNIGWNDNKELELRFQTQARYVLVPRRVLTRLCINFETGIGELNNDAWRFEIEPGIFWSIGDRPVTDHLGNYTGMYVRPNLEIGNRGRIDPSGEPRDPNWKRGDFLKNLDLFNLSVFVGFRWASN